MTNLPDTLRTLAVLALAIGLPDHAQELEHASRRDGTLTTLRTFNPCPSGVRYDPEYGHGFSFADRIAEWNDVPHRTKEHVVEIFQAATSRLR